MIYIGVLVYLIVIILYFEKNKSNTLNDLGLFMISILVPIFGLIITIIYNKDKNKDSKIVYEFEEERDEKLDDLDNFLLKNSHSNFYSNLLLKNYKEARKEIINFNKLTVNENSKLYIKALHSEDTEVSHMAAASLMKIKQQYEKDLKLSNNIQISDLEKYVLKLDEYVRNKLVSGKLKDNLIINCVDFAEKIINFKSLNLDYFIAYVNLLLEVNKIDLAKNYAYHIKNTWYYNEKSWICLFNVLLKDKNKIELIETIKEYKENNFEKNKEMEDFISFWEVKYEEEK